MNSQKIQEVISSISNQVVLFYSANKKMVDKSAIVLGSFVGISVFVLFIFGFFDSDTTKITKNNEILNKNISEVSLSISNIDNEIAMTSKSNEELIKSIVTINSSICGYVKQLGSDSVKHDTVCSEEEKTKYANINYDAVKDFVDRFVKNKGKNIDIKVASINTAFADSNTESTKKEQKSIPTEISNTDLPEGSKYVGDTVEHKYTGVDSLFYGTHINDKCYISQNEQDHFKSNSRIASDIACNKKKVFIHAPDFKNKEIEYTVKVIKNWDTGNSVLLFFKSPEDGTDYYWLMGHTASELKEWTKVKTGQVIGIMDLSGITEGYHLHQELWQWNNNVSYKIVNKVLQMRKEKTS